MKKNICLLLYCCTMSLTCFGQNTLEIESSSTTLVETFNWAKQKAYSFVQTGKQGPIDISKPNQESEMVNYIPSYWAGYPLRTAFYSRDFCHQALGAHLLDLQEENFTMLKAFAASSNLERKWYPLWALNFDGSPYKLDYRSDNDFVREVPATFELVEKAHLLYTWTKDKRYIEDAVLWNYYTKTVTDFISLHDNAFPNGVAEGSGLGSIFKGVATFNEHIDVPMIEAGDGIAAQYQAILSYAKMADARGEKTLAKEYFTKAEKLKEYFNTDWGVKNTDMYNRGYGINNNSIDGWGKENSWFMPMKGIVDENNTRTAKYLDFIDGRLESKDDIPNNIEALSYVPEMFFTYSQNERGWKWMKHIMSSIDKVHAQSTLTGNNGNYPEVSYVLISNIVEGLMGIQPLDDMITTASHLPSDIKNIKVSGMKIGELPISVSHLGTSQTQLTNNDDKKELVWRAKFRGEHKNLYVNGKKTSAKQCVDYGQIYSYTDTTIYPQKSVIVGIAK